MSASSPAHTCYVDPQRGDDRGSGSLSSPWRSLTWALAQSSPHSLIQLAPGTYNTASGERFPLMIPAGITVSGDAVSWGTDILITGGGWYNPTGFIGQNVTLVLAAGATVQGVTVTNAADNGTGIWVEAGQATIAHNTLTHCGREGVFISGTAKPQILDNRFQQNHRSGISLVRHGKGEIRRNQFEQTGYGLAIGEQGAPLLAENVIRHNRVGVLIWGEARPVLRHNQIEANASEGLVIVNQAIADLGHPQDPGQNRIRHNGTVDVHNATDQAIASVGNDLIPTRLSGAVELLASAKFPPFPPDGHAAATPPTAATETPAATATAGQTFTDLVGHWSESFVTGLVHLNVVRGFLDGTYRPEVGLTRAQFAAVLGSAFPYRAEVAPAKTFRDVPTQFWAHAAIAQATAKGFLSGFPDGSFRPDWPLTRAAAWVAVVNGLGWTGGDRTGLSLYRDRDQIPSYATTAIATATQRQIIVNYPRFDQLHPMQGMTRGAMAALIYQALVALGQAPVVASPYIVRPELARPLFADVVTHWAADFIYGLVNQGSMGGYPDGQFRPDTPMTRAQYAAVLHPALNPPPVRSATEFSDVPPDFWAADAIRAIAQAGFLSGFPDRRFRPKEPMPRAQVWVSLVNGLNWGKGDATQLSQFTDADQIPNFAVGAVATALMRGLVVNVPDREQLRPNDPATRAEVAAIVYQARVALRRSPPLTSPYMVQPPQTQTLGSGALQPFRPARSDAAGLMAPVALTNPVVDAVRAGSPPPAASGAMAGTASESTDAPAHDRDLPRATDDTQPQPNAATATRPPLVMLDPGHGGQDPGAIGRDRHPEKDIVLDIAQQTAQYLTLQDIPVQLTRSQDDTVELPDRVALTQAAGATLLLSLHCNAMSRNRPDVNGLETYHHPESTASAQLATHLHQAILAEIPFADRGIKAANFYILREVDIPAVLMELGFLTGAADAPRLSDRQFREHLAQAIAIGVAHYFEPGF